jgi:hypothetical protein
LFFFAVGASATRLVLTSADLLGKLGAAVFVPDLIGWDGAISGVVALMAVWYVLAGWYEQRGRLGRVS